MLALTWADIDLEAGTIDVNKHLTGFGAFDGTKSHDDGRRVLTMPQEAVAALSNLNLEREPMPSDAVFLTVYGKPMAYNTFSARFVKLKRACGLDDMHAHDLRHIHLSEFAKHATLAETMNRAGHTDHRSALRYQHVDAERQREIVARLSF